MSIRRKTATVLATGSILALSGLAAAPAANADTAGATRPAPPSAVVTGAGGNQLVSYDPATGRAVLTTGTASTMNRTASGTKAGSVKVGQVIDSLPCAAAPEGALLVVTDVQKAKGGRQTVSTRPAAINELLGDKSAAVHTAVTPSSLKVTSELPGLKVSYVPRIDGASASASMDLNLSADTKIPLPDGGSADFSGSVSLNPSIDFDYQGAAIDVQKAQVSFNTDAEAKWRVAGTFKALNSSVKIPIASLKASPVVWVGPVPVVVNTDLTLYAHITAEGTVTVDTEQSYTDNWGVHAGYTKQDGWTAGSDSGAPDLSPVTGSVSGHGDIRTGLMTEGTIAIFDSLGVKAHIEPYLRTVVSGKATFDGEGGVQSQTGPLELYGGVDIGGALMARLRILGTTLFEKELPFTVYREEWPLLTTEATA
ncbi:hypothetical protein HUT18_17370 [Streptomyces sp. NA04227]|uniref:hypothetical protein n=1 Tax=Streptomyces sp. NA04227 TaxID=2742136 RepID=UPI001591F1F8|nr:hypothetical protein [Streptomyces sp. NA04227]QKW07895.1 hypothetical protein HUT18_17370 [Streptomyces sp. NA04227]